MAWSRLPLSLGLLLVHILSVCAQTDTCSSYKTRIPGNTLGWITTGTDPPVPTPVLKICYPNNYGQCYVACNSSDTSGRCLSVANSELSTCTPQWSAYSCSSFSYYQASVSGSYTSTSSYYATSTSANPIYPTTIPSNYSFTLTSRGATRSYTPVYVLGNTTAQTTTSVYLSTVFTFTNPSAYIQSLYPVHPPICSVTAVGSFDCPCWLTAPSSAKVYYWPDQTPGPGGAFPTNIPATPATTVINGFTVTSPSVYVSIPTIIATNGCSYTVGQVRSNVVLALPPAQFSSQFQGGYSVYNFADLGPPVNAAAYFRQQQCWYTSESFCSTIYPFYAPPLSFPSQVTTVEPAWSTCYLTYYGIPASPPVSIRPRTTGTVPTRGNSPSATTLVTSSARSASPCSTPAPGTPTPTRT